MDSPPPGLGFSVAVQRSIAWEGAYPTYEGSSAVILQPCAVHTFLVPALLGDKGSNGTGEGDTPLR